tara:strand:- start:928 stop:1932 length:1005 start_codon:yes stop_codon:yes gene_type:complete
MLLYWFFPFTIIASSYCCVLFSITWSILPYIWVLIIVPILDLLTPKLNKTNKQLENTLGHNASLIAVVPAMFLLFYLSLIKISNVEISSLGAIAIGLGTGIAGGAIGITTAHELIHRKSKTMRGFGISLLVLCLYGHFRIEHIYGHHIHVATKNDPATARKGENFYSFLIRCIITGVISAWNIEKNILISKKLPVIGIKNRMFHYLIFQVLLISVSYYISGIKGIIYILFHSAISIILLELVEYIQHYGLERKRTNQTSVESYNHSHSWNSRHSVADWSTFNLGLHSEHHSIANKPYPLLTQDKKVREMPANYPTMILMALIPPIWFKVIDQKI